MEKEMSKREFKRIFGSLEDKREYAHKRYPSELNWLDESQPQKSIPGTVPATKSLLDNSLDIELQCEYDNIRFIEPLITKDMQKITGTLNTSLCGLEYSVKTASSIDDKMRRTKNESGDKKQKLAKFKDIIRYTQICKHENIIETTKRTIEELEKGGYKLVGLSNYYKNPYPNTRYKGMHLNFISPYGQVFELQVHSSESFEAKQQGHKLYEKIRAVSTPIEEKEKYKEKILKIHEKIQNPPGYETLDNILVTNKEIEEIRQNMEKCSTIVDRYQDTENNIYSVAYIVSFNNTVMLRGIENHLSDDSIFLRREFPLDNIREDIAMTNTGDVTLYDMTDEMLLDNDIKKISFSSELCTEMAEIISKKWLLENFDKEAAAVLRNDDVDNINSSYSQSVLTQVSELKSHGTGISESKAKMEAQSQSEIAINHKQNQGPML